ncbi:unnamed protein product [Lactuca virosa]|uniref:Protein kinase domain-containing protein n=1 Tax=Lactuca virosa TaxID=75947 RepID=A0AAU9NNT7_9ASTR|nr:unnamed protein product [Lactuca virosa]
MSVLKQFEHLRIRLEVIESATNNFSEDSCIGRGGFGKVYKGELLHSKGHSMVALKHLDRAFGQGDSEFWKEVIMLSVYRHQNIVSLLGFCDEKDQKILVYEYASNRSLDLHLDNKDLTWVRRLKVCLGAARGLAYLHDPGETQQRVLHRDIKSSNILDENWNARIADLGLSRFGPANQKYTFIVTNNTVGTIGYCDPLYLESGILIKESDVYSFGVVLFEVLCGRLCFGNNGSFTQLVRKHYRQNSLNEIVWSNIRDEIHPSSLKVFSKIAYQCLKSDNEKRPLMNDIVRGLETALQYQLSTALMSMQTSQPSFEKLQPEKVDLLEQVRRHDQYKWLETHGVGEESMVRNLPNYPRRDINRHICVDLLKRVPLFKNMNERLLDDICQRLKPRLYTHNSYLIREGDPVNEMLFIIRGCLDSETTDGLFNSGFLKEGDFCGAELLIWAVDPESGANHPSSTRTLKAMADLGGILHSSSMAEIFHEEEQSSINHTDTCLPDYDTRHEDC